MAEFTPMMQQYLQTKEEYIDCILFYRLGDFYEMFFEDAELVSKELELTLTGKNCGMEERAPMCGIPYHAVEGYLNKLVANGHKVAICEQVEDPKLAKGLVRREVIRIVTPGTNLDMQALDESKNNYIMCIVYLADRYGVSIADVSTGDYYVTEVDSERKLFDEITKFSPSEIICNESFYMSGVDIEDLRHRLKITIYALETWYFGDELAETTLLTHFKVKSLEALELADYDCGMIAAGALLKYLYETQKNDLNNISVIHPYSTGKYMIIDSSTRRNLELVETLREKQKRGSLLWVLDKTKTAMGARLLRSYVEQPLIDKAEIEKRQDAICELNQHVITREELREYLNPIYDLERLITRVTYLTANPRDLIAFRSSIAMLPPIKSLLGDFQCELLGEIREDMDTLEELCALIDRAIMEEPPISVRDGGLIKDGYNEDVDKYRKAKTEGKTWLAELEAKEREKTGIKNLKIKYNKVFGYYLEVTNSYKDLVPDYFMRKQTLANAERYITPELKELEDIILGAEDKLFSLEYNLFSDVREQIAKEVERIQKTAKAVAAIDVFASLALVAERNNYVCPKMNEKGVIDYDNVREIALRERPKLIVAGASAYARTIDFKKFREIADEAGAYLMVDMAHIAGLVAAGLHPSPIPYAHVTTTTTHKTLRGPRGGMILCNQEAADKFNFNKAVFPGIQGGPLEHVIAGKAVCFKEALQPEFKEYQQQILKNAQALCKGLQSRGVKIISGGTDNHLMLVDLRDEEVTGKELERRLDEAHITCNKNTIPNYTR